MIQNNQLFFEDGYPIQLGDLVQIPLENGESLIVELAETVVGQSVVVTPQGQQVIEQKGLIFNGRGTHQYKTFPVEQLAHLPLYEVVPLTYEVIE